MKNDCQKQKTDNTKPCLDCACPIPKASKRCIPDNCVAFQDWRRFIGTQINFLSLGTLAGVLPSIVLNIYQIHDIRQINETLEQTISQTKESIGALEARLLAVPDKYKERYSSFMKDSNSGIIKLLPRGKYEEAMLLRGGGSYYSFYRRTHEYGHGSDIELAGNDFTVGFAGLDFGFFYPWETYLLRSLNKTMTQFQNG